MAVYSSGSIHFSGLGSDLDVDSLITNLYKIESKHANQLISWRDDWQTRLDAFREVRSQVLSLQSLLQSMNTVDKFMAKNVSSSDTSIVNATLDSGSTEGVYNIQVNQLATNSIWSIDTGFSSKDAQVNNSGRDGSFTYTYKGKTRTINVPTGTTLEGLKNLINNDSQNPGVKVQLVSSSEGYVFQMRGMDTGSGATLEIDGTANLRGLGVEREDTWIADGTNSLTSVNFTTSPDAVVNNTETAKTFVFTVNDTKYSVKLAAGATLQDLQDAVNARTADSGVTASLHTEDVDGQTMYSLRLDAANDTDTLVIGNGTLEGYAGMTRSTNWQVQHAQNAELRVDGWPATGWLERSSNAVDDVVDGVTFNLRSKGEAVVSVELDTGAMRENIEKFVDGINELRVLLQSLTSVDSEKATVDSDYAESQFDTQKGSVLTGNYGIQMLSSKLKNIIASQSIGFTYLNTKNGVTTGDVFSTLSQIGITTDANSGSTTFGQLVINDTEGLYGSLTLDEALKKDPEGIAKLFAAKNEATTNSSDFAVNSHIVSITSAGTYNVSYSVDDDGTIVNAYINGKEAQIDQENRQIAIYSHYGAPNDADGLVLDVYNLTPGQTFSGSISIRNGKINELLGMMEGSEGLLGEEGTLKILENNYAQIITNIEDKIQKEDTRLAKWETTMRAKFARLESVLTTYNTMKSNLETQLEQLKSSSS